MYKREEHIKFISDNLAFLQASIEKRDDILKMYDINNLSENFLANLLNIVYDNHNLINVNEIRDNHAAIDLGDKTSSVKLAYQVTSDNSTTKIQKTIDEFINKKLDKEYDKLFVFIIKSKQKQVFGKIKTNGLVFTKSNVLDFDDIIKEIKKSKFPLTKLEKIQDFLECELTILKTSLIQQIPDEIAVKKLFRLFNRRALIDDFCREKSMYDFFNAFNEFIEFLSKGSLELKFDKNSKLSKPSELVKGKSRFEFDNQKYQKLLDKIYLKAIQISDLYVDCVKNGDINPDAHHFAFFRDPDIPVKFNNLRREMIKSLNELFKLENLSIININY